MKKTSSLRTVDDNVITQLNNSIVCFGYHLHILRCLQRTRGQQRTFCTCEKATFAEQKNVQQR